MDFKELQYILAIAKYGNLTRAANALYLTQPALSRFLRSTEEELGTPLFERIGHHYRLTYAGERYVEHARSILNVKQDLDREFADLTRNEAGVLRIGFPEMRGTYMLPATLPEFRRQYPNVRIDLHEGTSTDLKKQIQAGDVDIAFFNVSGPDPNFEQIKLSDDELYLIVRHDDPLCAKGRPIPGSADRHMDLTDIGDAGCILLMPEQQSRQMVDRICAEEGYTPNIILETSNIPMAYELAAQGYGCFFISATHLRHMQGLDRIRCFAVGTPRTTMNFSATYRRNGYLPFHAKAYMDIVRANI